MSYDNKNRILVDVIIPTYNHADYIKKAINSTLNQIKVRTSIIVVDDGSTDHTYEVVQELKKRYKNINYIKQSNKGLSSARNKGILKAKSEYVAFLDSDDFWEKDKLVKQIEVFVNSGNSKLGVVYCNFRNVNEKEKKLPKRTFSLRDDVKGYIYDKLLEGNYISGSGSAVLVKRECFEKCGCFDENLEACEDWDMWLRLSKKYEYDYVNEDLVNIRLSKGSMSRNLHRMSVGMAQMYDKHPDLLYNQSGMDYLRNVVYPQIINELPRADTITMIKKKVKPDTYSQIFKFTISGSTIFIKSIINRILSKIIGLIR